MNISCELCLAHWTQIPVIQVDDFLARNGPKHGSINLQSGHFRPMQHHIVLEPPRPEIGESVQSLEIAGFDGYNTSQCIMKPVKVFDLAEFRLVVDLVGVPRHGIDVIQNECDGPIIIRPFVAHHAKPNVFHGAPVEPPLVALVYIIDLISRLSFENGFHVLREIFVLLFSISVGNQKNHIWNRIAHLYYLLIFRPKIDWG